MEEVNSRAQLLIDLFINRVNKVRCVWHPPPLLGEQMKTQRSSVTSTGQTLVSPSHIL